APERYRAKKPADDAARKAESDTLWVAEKLADILGAVALSNAHSKADVYRTVLQKMSDAIGADNGFLMIPHKETKRWVIQAWVGNSDGWTSYEKSHPVPLTVANKAFKSGEIVTNADSDSAKPVIDASMSMMNLKVHHYIAVPLTRKGERAGLLYFDTRRLGRMFGDRHVKLLERAGSYVLEIDRRVEGG
ncbi:GAF domain-containing protein, partial [Candidatus Poribacteria bacterium]|nr:GAF domain-containing protein [Candidatus Poribacteria bacterium]